MRITKAISYKDWSIPCFLLCENRRLRSDTHSYVSLTGMYMSDWAVQCTKTKYQCHSYFYWIKVLDKSKGAVGLPDPNDCTLVGPKRYAILAWIYYNNKWKKNYMSKAEIYTGFKLKYNAQHKIEDSRSPWYLTIWYMNNVKQSLIEGRELA